MRIFQGKSIFLLSFLLFFQLIKAQLLFQDRASELGVGVTYGTSNLGGGVSFYDFDGDGWDDITYATTKDKPILFFKNNKGSFERVDLGIENTFETKQVLWVDYDNDGDKDFFATSITGLNKLYENNGNMTFTDISSTCGLFTDNLYSYGASFGDIDNDGDLDVFIANRDVITTNQHNYLYLNEDGFFTDITKSSGLYLGNDLSFCASFFDYDNDGYQDIYVSNDKYLKINRLFRNNGDATFEDVSVSSGAGMAIDAMSTTIEDYNGDGWLDIYVTNTFEGNYHLRNNKDGTFTNVADELGTGMYSIGWGAVFLDVDNDADIDLYVSDGSTSLLPSVLFENDDGIFTIPQDIGFGFDTRESYSNAMGDINNDGFPDIIVMNDSDDNYLWQNKTANSNNWLKIGLQGTVSNRDGIGSKIEVLANGRLQYRYTVCGEGYLGQNSSYEFFGLKDATIVDYVEVTWLSGTVDRITDVSVNRTLNIVEGNGAFEEDYGEVPEEEEEEEQEDADSNVEEDSGILCSGNEMLLFPNPSSDGRHELCSDFGGHSYSIEVYDLKGRQVATRSVLPSDPTFSLSELNSGVYLLRITGNNKTFFKKLLKL